MPRILTFCSGFPNPAEPEVGQFVSIRAQHMARLAELRVVAPLAWAHRTARGFRMPDVPASCEMDGLRVDYPRWFHGPLVLAPRPWLLAAQSVRRIRGVRSEFPFEVIDAHYAFPDGAAAALLSRRLKCPFTITMRGSELDYSKIPSCRRWMAWAMPRAARVFCNSDELRALALELGADPARAITVPNGVDATIFHPRGRPECRAQLGIGADTKLILSAGSLIAGKGHQHVIQALPALRARLGDVSLRILGVASRRASHERELRALVERLGLSDVVRFGGHVDQQTLAMNMCAADLFCLASAREGWPNVVQEALACGTPVVAFDVGAIPQMLPATNLGMIVPAGDTAALARALEDGLGKQWDHARISAWGSARPWPTVAAEVVEQMTDVVREAGIIE